MVRSGRRAPRLKHLWVCSPTSPCPNASQDQGRIAAWSEEASRFPVVPTEPINIPGRIPQTPAFSSRGADSLKRP